MRTASLLFLGVVLMHTSVRACDCAMEIPGTFCQTIDPEWNEPHIVVLGVKLNEVYYGMRVKVIEVFDGDVVLGDTITVWGDNGALCRHYVGTWNDGDTVLWGFHETDFLGNWITAGFPVDLEQPGDYHISFCGTYWLPYANGTITGAIAPGVSIVAVGEFWAAIEDCLSTGISEAPRSSDLLVRDGDGGPWLSMTTRQRAQLTVTDAMGRSCIARDWDGSPVQLSGMAAGVYLVQVQARERYWMRRVLVR